MKIEYADERMGRVVWELPEDLSRDFDAALIAELKEAAQNDLQRHVVSYLYVLLGCVRSIDPVSALNEFDTQLLAVSEAMLKSEKAKLRAAGLPDEEVPN